MRKMGYPQMRRRGARVSRHRGSSFRRKRIGGTDGSNPKIYRILRYRAVHSRQYGNQLCKSSKDLARRQACIDLDHSLVETLKENNLERGLRRKLALKKVWPQRQTDNARRSDCMFCLSREPVRAAICAECKSRTRAKQ